MRKKEKKQVITFPSTTSAMAFESAAQAARQPGRLVPVPHSIKAGCGMCWICPLSEGEMVLSFAREAALLYEGVYTEMMF